MIAITINEQLQNVREDLTLAELTAAYQPGADLLIVNGFPQEPTYIVRSGDQVVLIKRGAIPVAAEMQALLRARQTPGLCDLLAKSVVGIAGVGGLGSHVAMSLCRCGVGELILVDFDVVEPSNLNRQLYSVEQIGQPKVLALRETLLKANPYVKITSHLVELKPELVKSVFGRAGVVVEAFDRAEAKAMLLMALRQDLPATPGVFASGLAGDGAAPNMTTRWVYDNIYLVGDGVSAAAPGVGLLAPRVMLAAGLQAVAVLRLLQGKDPLN